MRSSRGTEGKKENGDRAEPRPRSIAPPGHSGRLVQPGLDLVQYGSFIRELPGLQLRVDQLAVERHLEAPAAGRDQLELADLGLERAQDLARQTEGFGFVPSS